MSVEPHEVRETFSSSTASISIKSMINILTYLLINDTLKLEREDESMHNMAYTLDNIIPITMFNRGQAGRIFSEVKKGSPKVVIKNNEPEAVIISPDEYKEIMELLENAELMEMAIQRETNDNGARFSQNEVMEELGISQADLDEMEDVEIG